MATRLPIHTIRDPIHLLALGFGSGLSPWAPGTAGSLVAMLPAWFMLSLSWPLRLAIALAVVALGIWVCGVSARRLEQHDHPAIVLDEIAAMLLLTVVLAEHFGLLLLGFALFRVFDILKPWPIRDLDHRLGGGLGIMLDDVLAAVYAAVCLVLFQYLLATV